MISLVLNLNFPQTGFTFLNNFAIVLHSICQKQILYIFLTSKYQIKSSFVVSELPFFYRDIEKQQTRKPKPDRNVGHTTIPFHIYIPRKSRWILFKYSNNLTVRHLLLLYTVYCFIMKKYIAISILEQAGSNKILLLTY